MGEFASNYHRVVDFAYAKAIEADLTVGGFISEVERTIKKPTKPVILALAVAAWILASCAGMNAETTFAPIYAQEPAPVASMNVDCKVIAKNKLTENNFGDGKLVAVASGPNTPVQGIIFLGSLGQANEYPPDATFSSCTISGVDQNDPSSMRAILGLAGLDIQSDLNVIVDGQ